MTSGEKTGMKDQWRASEQGTRRKIGERGKAACQSPRCFERKREHKTNRGIAMQDPIL